MSLGMLLSGLSHGIMNAIGQDPTMQGQVPQGAYPPGVAPPQAPVGPPVHKGMFGVHGTLRDILGTLGDAFLVNSGHDAIYSPRHQQEKVADAMVGHGDYGSPEMIQAVASQDPAFAQKIYEAQSLNNYRGTIAGIRRDATDSRVGVNNEKVEETIRGRAGAMLAAGLPLETVLDYGKSKGYDWSNLADMKPEERDAWATGNSVSTKDQVKLNQGQQNITERGRHNQATEAIGNRQAGAAETRAGAAATSAGASVSRAATAAQIAPSTIDKNNAEADYTRKGGDLGAGKGAPVKARRVAPGQAPQASGPVRVTSVQQAMGLPKGTKFIDPQGKVRIR